jgi:hypothetical protein
MSNLTIGSFDRAAQVEVWRNKCRDGTMTLEEYKQVIIHLRAGRAATPQATSGSRSKSKATATAKPAVSGDDLLSQLDGL